MNVIEQSRSQHKVFFLNNLDGKVSLDQLNELTMKLISATTNFGQSELKSIFIINADFQAVTRVAVDGVDKDAVVRSMTVMGYEDAKDFLYYHEPMIGELETPVDALMFITKYYESLKIDTSATSGPTYHIQPLGNEWVVTGGFYPGNHLFSFNSQFAAEIFMGNTKAAFEKLVF